MVVLTFFDLSSRGMAKNKDKVRGADTLDTHYLPFREYFYNIKL